MRFVCLVSLFAVFATADINSVMNEPNLERRSERALENADEAVGHAKKAYSAQDMAGYQKALKEVLDSIELCYKSLQESGKKARRSPKYFKKADMRLHDLSKRLDNLEKEVMIEDRGTVTSLKHRVDELNEQVVLDIMTKK